MFVCEGACVCVFLFGHDKRAYVFLIKPVSLSLSKKANQNNSHLSSVSSSPLSLCFKYFYTHSLR